MRTVGGEGEREVDVIVDEEQRAPLAAEVADGLRLGELLALVAGLVTPLDDPGAASEGESRHVNRVAAARLLRVDNDIQAADLWLPYGHWSCPSL